MLIHKTEPWWLDLVKDLTPGGKRRVADGQTVSFNGESYFLYDFREKDGELWKPELSPAEKLALIRARQEAQEAAAASCDLPVPQVLHPGDWPVAARVWLYKAHFNNDMIRELGIFWHPDMRRVVLPLNMLDGSKAWVARKTEVMDGPKYLAPGGMYRGGGAVVSVGSDTLVLTEDILSAWRVSGACKVDALAILGTTIGNQELAIIASSYKRCVIWTDPDAAGRDGRRKLYLRLGRFGTEVSLRITDRDPKLYSDEELKELLWQTT